jgi:UDP-2,3-diacylglucosamine pyrophosphatase LpxH
MTTEFHKEMLLVVSDLHLTDAEGESTFRPDVFVRTIREAVRGARSVRLLLLGDIFEMLKSRVWEQHEVRPWEKCTVKHQAAVCEIFGRVLSANAVFFDALLQLRDELGMSIAYVPGNHDRPLNTEMGDGCRARLRQRLRIEPGDDRLFPEFEKNEEYGVFASHGHSWDEANSYDDELVAIGDFIVIDVLTRLPHVLAGHLDLSPMDEELRFAHEIDDVIPQTPAEMARRLTHNVRALSSHRAPRALKAAIGEIAEELEQRMRGYRFGSTLGTWWAKMLKGVAFDFARTIDVVKWVRRLSVRKPPGEPPYVTRAQFELVRAGQPCNTVIYGHTHIPEHRTIWNGGELQRYLNCGTWRRAHRAMDFAIDGRFRYATSHVSAMAIVRTAGETTKADPSYELRQSYYA